MPMPTTDTLATSAEWLSSWKPTLSLTPFKTSIALRRSLRATVKVMLALVPSEETFCTIMSTLISASARGPKIEAETPGWSFTCRIETFASSRE